MLYRTGVYRQSMQAGDGQKEKKPKEFLMVSEAHSLPPVDIQI
jgi:hypothetical protein